MDEILKKDFEEIYKREVNWDVFRNKTFLLTGISGMMTSYFCLCLLYLSDMFGLNIRIIGLGRKEEKAKEKLGEYFYHKNFMFRDDDLKNPIIGMPHADFVVHAASNANPENYVKVPISVAEPNVIGTYYLLNYAVETECKKFLYFSSGDVYGIVDDPTNIDEETVGKVNQLSMHSCYSESKRMGETWCKLFFAEKKIETVIARIAHTYSPTMDVENDPRVFAAFVNSIINNRNIVLNSDGTARRPFCYIADAIVAFLIMLEKGNGGEAYNVCNTSEFLSMNELAELLIKINGNSELSIIHKNNENVRCDNKENKNNKPSEMKLINLGWRHIYSAAEGFDRVLLYMKK